MTSKISLYAAAAATMLSIPAMADARSLRAVGSSTVYPFAKAVAERVARANPKLGSPIIESTGTGAGFKLFCAGVGERFPDISDASRRMKASEAKLCAASGVKEVTEIQIGIDGIAFATAKGTPLSELTTRDIYVALAKTPFGKPNKAKTWKDVNAKLPAIPIRVYGPPPTSGTRDAFGELIMTAGCETNAGMVALKKANADKHKAICTGVREDGAFIEAGENDNLIVQKLAANPNTVGIFGYSFLEENTAQDEGHLDQRRPADLPDDQQLPVSGSPSALHLCEECACPGNSGYSCLRGGIHQGKRDRAQWLPQAARPCRRACTAFGPKSQQAARTLTPVKFAELK